MMITPDLKTLLQMKSFIKDDGTLSSRENVDNFLLSYLSFLSDKNYPALEIGVYEGASAGYLCEALKMQNRKVTLIDNLHFLKSNEEQNTFVKDVIGSTLSNVGILQDQYEMIVDSSLTHDFGEKTFSYIHIDAHNPLEDLKNALKISSANSLICVDDFLIVPYHLEVVTKAIINQEVFPIAMATKKIWMANNKAFADAIMDNKAFWGPLHDVLRFESFNFFGNPIFKFYQSKKYHQQMYNYFNSPK